jgi:flavoprotein
MRNPDTLIAGNRSGAVFICPDGSALYLRKQTDLVLKLVELLREPRSLGEIEEELQVSAAEVERLIALLEKRRIILRDVPEKLATLIPPVPRTAERLCQNVVVGICGAVQAATSVPLLVAIQRTLAKEVDVILTDSAEKFVKPEALSYFGFRVWNDMYQTQAGANVPHIHLATQADLVLVVPATAHAIHRVASGACSDLLSLIISATQAPVVVVPTMNTAMLQYAPIRKNIEQLRACGIYVVEPGLGCEVSKGHDDAFRFCGIGLTEANIFRGITAIVTAHRELAAGRSSTGAVPSRVRAMEQAHTGAVTAEKLQEPA